MNIERLKDIEKEIDAMLVDILSPVRMSKTIDKELYKELCSYLDEIKNLVKGQETIPRNLAGLLFFIYTTISSAARFSKYTDFIFMAASEIEGYLDEILWDSPWK